MNQVAGLDINMAILLVGGVCIFYTSLGGMKAVIWGIGLDSDIGKDWKKQLILDSYFESASQKVFLDWLIEINESKNAVWFEPVIEKSRFFVNESLIFTDYNQ